MMEAGALEDTLSGLTTRFGDWVASTDQTSVLIAISLTLVAVFARRPVARFFIYSLDWFLKQFSVELPESAKEELTVTTSVLIVTLAAFFSNGILEFADSTDQLIRRILASAAIMAVFAGWYNLCEPVRRQSFWNQERRKLRECSAHLAGVIMRHVDCVASVAFRRSSA